MDWQLIFVSASFVTMLGVVLKISDGFRKDLDENVKLLFKRFDAHKDSMDQKLVWLQDAYDKKYMRADNCNLIQLSFSKEMENVKKELVKIGSKLDMLIEERRIG